MSTLQQVLDLYYPDRPSDVNKISFSNINYQRELELCVKFSNMGEQFLIGFPDIEHFMTDDMPERYDVWTDNMHLLQMTQRQLSRYLNKMMFRGVNIYSPVKTSVGPEDENYRIFGYLYLKMIDIGESIKQIMPGRYTFDPRYVKMELNIPNGYEIIDMKRYRLHELDLTLTGDRGKGTRICGEGLLTPPDTYPREIIIDFGSAEAIYARPDKTMIKRGILAKNFKKNTLEKIADTAVLMLSL